jgi:hypothetical protein
MGSMPRMSAGSRMFIAGSTGSGKSTLASHFIDASRQHAVVLNPKHTAAYAKTNGVNVIDEVKMNKIEKSIIKNKVTVLNLPAAYFDPIPQDEILKYLHLKYENIMLVADELTTLHKGGRCFSGLKSVLTMGRELNQSFIGCTQRPAWLDQHVMSESEYYVCMYLKLARDRKRMMEEIGHAEIMEKIPKRWWFWKDDNDPADRLRLFKPIPLK